MQSLELELAGEYLLMASILAEIKSRLLLPRVETEVQEEDPRADLIRRLQEYEQIKHAAENLDAIPRLERDYFTSAALSLVRAEKLWVIGFGDNYPLAHFARAQLIKIKPDIRMIPIGGFSVNAITDDIGISSDLAIPPSNKIKNPAIITLITVSYTHLRAHET